MNCRSVVGLFVSTSIVTMLAACGGASSVASSTQTSAPNAGAATVGAAAERCLAKAEAKRERKASEPSSVGVKHVLVKYAGAKSAAPTVTRTREQACLRAEEALAKLKEGASFADVVSSYSEEAGAATREGSLGAVTRAEMAKPFADAAFELARGEVSDVVESPFGFHLILRVE